jgi:hypothetical protein
MNTRVSPSERIRAEIDDLIAGAERGSLRTSRRWPELRCAWCSRPLWEAELTEFLGRDRYARGERERTTGPPLQMAGATGLSGDAAARRPERTFRPRRVKFALQNL